MIDPQNIAGFLDFGALTGPWQPALIGVIGGAVLTHALLLRLLERRAARAGTATAAPAPPPARIDAALVVGSAIFGVGWGLSGYCPGPAIVALGFGAGRVWLFVATLIAGSLAADAFRNARTRTRPRRRARAAALRVSAADR